MKWRLILLRPAPLPKMTSKLARTIIRAVPGDSKLVPFLWKNWRFRTRFRTVWILLHYVFSNQRAVQREESFARTRLKAFFPSNPWASETFFHRVFATVIWCNTYIPRKTSNAHCIFSTSHKNNGGILLLPDRDRDRQKLKTSSVHSFLAPRAF